jgi:hypothetical protein
VQLVFGWNNKKLQDNAASVEFRAASTVRTTTTWTCDRDAGPQTQERNNTTVTTLQGLIASVARDRNQVTGFILNGFEGDVEEIVVDNDGPAVGSCPTFWTAIDLVEGEPESLGGGLEVNAPGFDWTPIS